MLQAFRAAMPAGIPANEDASWQAPGGNTKLDVCPGFGFFIKKLC